MALTEFAQELLQKHYCRPGETVDEAFWRACDCFGTNGAHATRLKAYIDKKWFMFSSPILSNAVKSGETPKGLPISCFTTYVDDSIGGLCDHTTETRWLSVKGGGVGGHWSDVRSMSDTTPGAVGFMHTTDADMLAYRQGKTRRGSYASYMDISHPEIIEFIKMRVPTGDLNRKNLNLHHGVNITKEFVEAVQNGTSWHLIDPHSKEVKETLAARELWEEIVTTRFRTGEPYINYVDEANDKMHPALKAKGLQIHGSNLCNEIHLPTDNNRTGVCCLSSVNVAKFDEWSDNEYFIGDLIEMLDNVLSFFIDHAPDALSKAAYSAQRERSLGLGAMGFHDYLQKKGYAWESPVALVVNRKIFKLIKEKADETTRRLAVTRGEAPDAEGYGVRNTHLMAIAPNANSSIILGVSASIEPRASNCYTHKTRVGSYLVKNPQLEEHLESIGQNTKEVWESIMSQDGSVLHLDFLPEEVREVYKTAYELDQLWVIDHARARQEFICQGQSVNVFFPSGADKNYVNLVHRKAFIESDSFPPLKGLYYLRTESSKKTEKVNIKVKREALQDGVQGTMDSCLACEG